MRRELFLLAFCALSLVSSACLAAGWPGECAVVHRRPSGPIDNTDNIDMQILFVGATGVESNGEWTTPASYYYYDKTRFFYYQNGAWVSSPSTYSISTAAPDDLSVGLVSVSGQPSSSATCEDYYPTPCKDERESLITLCGSANYYINEETCVGECSCDPDKLYEDLQSCEEGQLADVDYDKCTVTCGECAEEKAALEAECGSAGVTDVGPNGCGGRCRDCLDYYDDAAADCADRGGVASSSCESDRNGKMTRFGVPAANGNGVVDWLCKDDLLDPTEDPPEDPKEPEEPEPKPDPKDPEPDPTNPDDGNNGWLEALKKNSDTAIEQRNHLSKQVDDLNKNLYKAVENQGVDVENQKKHFKGIAEGLEGIRREIVTQGEKNSNTSKAETPVDMTGVESRLDGIGDKLEELKPGNDFGEITSSDFGEPYSLDEEFDVSNRFGTFIDTIKTTGLFSVPNQFFGSLPSGGSSLIHIDAGQYGDHSVDLNDTLGPGLVVLRSLFVIIFGFFSIRAVVMKR